MRTFDPALFNDEAQAAAQELFEQFARTEDDAKGSLDEAAPFVFARIAQKGVTGEDGQPLVMPGAVVFFTSTETAGVYDRIKPRGTMDAHPYDEFVGIFAGGSKGRVNWGGGTPEKGKEPLCKSSDGKIGMPSDDFATQIPNSGQCFECPFRTAGCDETRAFVVALRLTEEESETFGLPYYPVIMQFTKSAIGFIANYNMWITGHGKADLGPLLKIEQPMYWHDVISALHCKYTPRKGGYYTPDFEYKGLVNPEIVPHVRALRETSMDRMLPAASSEDVLDANAADYGGGYAVAPTHAGPR